MRDNDQGIVDLQLMEQLLYGRGGDGIQRGGGFVEEQHFRFHRHCTGDTEPLLLSAGEEGALFIQGIFYLIPQCDARERVFYYPVPFSLGELDPIELVPGDDIVIDAQIGKGLGRWKTIPIFSRTKMGCIS